MATIKISLPEDRLRMLKEKAELYHVAPEDLVRAGIEQLLARPDEDLQEAVSYVLEKNAGLYRRLA